MGLAQNGSLKGYDMSRFKKWSFRIVVTGSFILGLLIMIALCPVLLYADNTASANDIVYHQHQLDPTFITRLNDANALLKASEIYDSKLSLSICLNDGSLYPILMRRIRGDAFGWGFAYNVVLMGNMNATDNTVELNGYKWNLTELLAHEATHCYQFNKFGLLHSNPLACIPTWKWEGYPEYVSRKHQASLVQNITHLLQTEQADNNGWISFDDSTGTVIAYYQYWLLMQYCLDIQKMTYAQLLKDTTSANTFQNKMMVWYETANSTFAK